MTFALCLQVPNHFRFNRKLDIYTNFIPQIVFLESIFGYLVVCILYKWSIDWSQVTRQPPSLLNMLISMFLEPGHVDPKAQLYPGQATVQAILLLIAVICVPWLLVSKPYFLWKEMHKNQGQGYMTLDPNSAADDLPQRLSDRISLEDEEEGNGQALLQGAEVQEVCTLFPTTSSFFDHSRNIMTSVRWLFIKSSTPSSFVSDAFRIRRLISDFGRFPLHMRSYRKYFGQ